VLLQKGLYKQSFLLKLTVYKLIFSFLLIFFLQTFSECKVFFPLLSNSRRTLCKGALSEVLMILLFLQVRSHLAEHLSKKAEKIQAPLQNFLLSQK